MDGDTKRRGGWPGPRRPKRTYRINPDQDQQIREWAPVDGGESATVRDLLDRGIRDRRTETTEEDQP